MGIAFFIPKGVCRDFIRRGICPRQEMRAGCPYKHNHELRLKYVELNPQNGSVMLGKDAKFANSKVKQHTKPPKLINATSSVTQDNSKAQAEAQNPRNKKRHRNKKRTATADTRFVSKVPPRDKPVTSNTPANQVAQAWCDPKHPVTGRAPITSTVPVPPKKKPVFAGHSPKSATAKSTANAQQPWYHDDVVIWAHANLRKDTAERYIHAYTSRLDGSFTPEGERASHKEKDKECFILFPFLPAEIRIQIWETFLNDRGHTARIKLHAQEKLHGHVIDTKFTTRSRQPALLQVNRESRDVALQHYELAFGTIHNPPMTYYNFKKDKLILHTRSAMELYDAVEYLLPKDRERIKVMVLPLRDWVKSESERTFSHAIAKFHDLRLLQLMVGDGKMDARWANDKKMPKKVMEILCYRCESGTPSSLTHHLD